MVEDADARDQLLLMMHFIVDQIGLDTDPATVTPPIPAHFHEMVRRTQAVARATAELQDAERLAGVVPDMAHLMPPGEQLWVVSAKVVVSADTGGEAKASLEEVLRGTDWVVSCATGAAKRVVSDPYG